MYPIGIPALYATILWKNRELLNPRIRHGAKFGSDGLGEAATSSDGDADSSASAMALCVRSKGSNVQTKNGYSRQELHELEELVEARRVHPELVPSMFLWKDFGEVFCKAKTGLHIIGNCTRFFFGGTTSLG